MNCRWNGRGNPRLVTGRHEADCADEACGGCQVCTEAHCRICGVAHCYGTCPECLAETREALHEIARMCDALPDEVEHRGVDSEAMMLWGPAADPEMRGHVEAAYLSGRLPEGWIEAAHGKACPLLVNEACTGCAAGELHPLTILGTWEIVWRDALEHDDNGEPMSVAGAVDYLDLQMTYMSTFEHVPFEDFARDVRRCRNHLEAVLHDGEQVDRGAPCMTCHAPLERTWGSDAKGDGWKCPRCKQTSTDEQYRFAVMHLHRSSAEWLTDRDMEIRTGVKAGTVRAWASRGEIERKQDQGRRVYSVSAVKKKAGIMEEDSA